MAAAPLIVTGGAIISEGGRFRSRLWRIWDTELPRVLWLMLNPSTAGVTVNDPTIKTIIDFTQRWGFGGIEVCNAYDFRTKSPALLKASRYPCSPTNGLMLRAMMDGITAERGKIVAAWGTHIQPNRAIDIRVDAQLISVPLWHLGLTKGGQPRHPLYVRRDTALQLLPVPL